MSDDQEDDNDEQYDQEDDNDEQYDQEDDQEGEQGEEYNEEGEEYNERDTDTVYKPERNAHERVGLPGFMVVANPQSRLEKAMMDPLDRFRLYVDGVSRNLNNWYSIKQTDIDKMLIMSGELDTVEHKNPTAYILGYLSTSGGVKMSKEQFNRVIKDVLPHVEDESVKPEDIIRYSRLWLNLKK